MKRIIVTLMLCTLLAGAASADIVVQNEEDGGLYFKLLPLDGEVAKGFAADPQAGLDFLRKNVATLDYLSPYGAVRTANGDGPSLLLGFFVSPENERLPLVSLKIPPTSKVSAFSVSKQNIRYDQNKKALGFDAWEIQYRRYSVHLDNRYLDWIKIPDLVKFSAAYSPGNFSRETGGKQETRKIGESLFWKKGGCQIETVKAFLEDRYLFFMLSSLTEMTEGLSYFFYLFDDRKANGKRLTVEVPIRKNSGPVFLWLPGSKNPVTVGSYVRGAFLLEAQIDFGLLPEGIDRDAWSDPSIDLTSCFFDGGHSEEFFFTTFMARDIPNKK